MVEEEMAPGYGLGWDIWMGPWGRPGSVETL